MEERDNLHADEKLAVLRGTRTLIRCLTVDQLCESIKSTRRSAQSMRVRALTVADTVLVGCRDLHSRSIGDWVFVSVGFI